MPVVTITVNQWRIKSNAETGANDPVICVNHYEWTAEFPDHNGTAVRGWGSNIGETQHYHVFVLPTDAKNVRTIYDPVNKTPCQASCWMQFNY